MENLREITRVHREVKETWKGLVYNRRLYEDYEVSSLGNIRSLKRGIRVLKPRRNKKHPHLFVDVWDTGTRTTVYIHKAVYETWKGGLKRYVAHKNGIITDNFVGNLYSITHSELQKQNMVRHPVNRWALSKRNLHSGYYERGGANALKQDKINEIRALAKKRRPVATIAIKVGVSISSVYKYRD